MRPRQLRLASLVDVVRARAKQARQLRDGQVVDLLVPVEDTGRQQARALLSRLFFTGEKLPREAVGL